MNKIYKVILPILTLIFFIGCSSGKLSLPIISKPLVDKPIVANGIGNMPKDAAKVILAVSAKILNPNKRTRGVFFQQKLRTELVDAKFFGFANAVLISLKNNGDYKKLHADIYFKDSIDRSLSYSLNTTYSTKNGEIKILNLELKNKYTNASNSVCFILPADAYMSLSKKTFPKNFYKLYKFAAQNSIIPEKTSGYKRESEWAIMVFVLNRISQSATLTLGISETTDSYDNGYTSDTKYINYNGWRVGVIMGKFHLMQPDSMRKLYAKLIFKPGKENHRNTFFTKQRVIGLYRIR